jgi:thioredoxin-like negative regulator of GroEL
MIEILLEAERALSVGQLEHAERLYRQAADADPRNSIAVVGLARVVLERGDDPGAYLLARRALAIDPENDAARRLADRLLEVMRTRGDDLPADPALSGASRPGPTETAPNVPVDSHAPPRPRRKRRRSVLGRLFGR